MKIKAILLSLLCFVGITTATAQSDVWVWKGGSAVKTEMADSITFTAPALTGPRDLAEATTEDIGKIIAEAAGITAVAMIAYVGNDAETNSTYRHGLALALKDASGPQQWCTLYSEICLSNQYPDVFNMSPPKGDMAGLANTDALVYHSSHTHAAATAVRKYKYADGVAEGVHPLVTSEWFLPSAGQWDKMATAAGGYAKLTSNAGLQSDLYWTSTEINTDWVWGFAAVVGRWIFDYKDYVYLVRACLAF